MTGDPDDVFGPVVAAPAEPVRGPKQTEARPLAEIQAELRAETARRGRGEFRGAARRRQV